MNEGVWEDMGAGISPSFGEPLCPVGYGPVMKEGEPVMMAAIEKTMREEGLSDEVFEKLSPKAEGEFVVVITVYRFVPQKKSDTSGQSSTTPMPSMGGGGRGRGGMGRGMGGGGSGRTTETVEDRVLEITLSAYSVALHHLVAQMNMRYSGADNDEAMTTLKANVQRVLGPAHCMGWKW